MTVQLQKMKMLIAGEWKDSTTGARSSILDPSSGETIAEVPKASKQDAKAAVDSAREAFRILEREGEYSRSLRVLCGRTRTSLQD
jgi:acyl-CoA reductase-like NAD-dependent aldehyde dehydrogenase